MPSERSFLDNPMSTQTKKIIQDNILAGAILLYDEKMLKEIEIAASVITQCLKSGHTMYIFGKGGSAADSQHFSAELIGRFQKERIGLAAVALTTDTSTMTALGNDYGFEFIFKRQLEALAKPHDIAFAISTSGKAHNVLEAVSTAKKRKLKTICLTGKDGGALAKKTDLAIIAPGDTTARIQEMHILIIHILCHLIESNFKKS